MFRVKLKSSSDRYAPGPRPGRAGGVKRQDAPVTYGTYIKRARIPEKKKFSTAGTGSVKACTA